MDLKVYLPYFDYAPESQTVDDSYYEDENAYIKALSDDYNKNKDIVSNYMMDRMDSTKGSMLGSDGKTYGFAQKTQQTEENVAYSECEAVMYDDSGNEETVDTLITHFAKQESFVTMFDLNLDYADEDFLTELSLWKREHDRITSYGNISGEEWVIANEPVRDVRIMFINNAKEEVYGLLRNCRIMDFVEPSSIILFVDGMELIDKFN